MRGKVLRLERFVNYLTLERKGEILAIYGIIFLRNTDFE